MIDENIKESWKQFLTRVQRRVRPQFNFIIRENTTSPTGGPNANGRRDERVSLVGQQARWVPANLLRRACASEELKSPHRSRRTADPDAASCERRYQTSINYVKQNSALHSYAGAHFPLIWNIGFLYFYQFIVINSIYSCKNFIDLDFKVMKPFEIVIIIYLGHLTPKQGLYY